ncbi:MAG: TetR family transcriptional regulator [Bifidobacteriaceae bacterium]|nr:TetR family transcriptional regulator [Bifidobacteriaceae bacterium]
MRSTNGGRDSDLTAKARIRDAAIRLFSKEGFGVSVRKIATAAAVSPGLIIHHFGAKDGLRAECDEYVGQIIVELKTATMAAPIGSVEANLMHQLANVEKYQYVLGYLLNSVNTGGPAARAFIDTMTAATVSVLERGVAAGRIRPSRDPVGRAKFLTDSSIGSLLVWAAARSTRLAGLGAPDTNEYLAEFAIPSLELYTEGLFSDSATLDAYLAATATEPPTPKPTKEATERADPPTNETTKETTKESHHD